MVPGLTDTHCNLNHADFNNDRTATIARAISAGVERLLVIGYDLASSRFAVEIATGHPQIQAVIGIHPESAAEWTEPTRDALLRLLAENRDKIVGWGEIGLDYHWQTVGRDEQKRVFCAQLDIAAENDLPVVIHCRDAYADTFEILRERQFSRAVMHCFVGTADEAETALGLGLHLGFGGVATYKKSNELRRLISSMPSDRILLETDSPYLAPQQWRGKRNEPAYIESIAQLVAELRGTTPQEIAAITSRNANELFGVR